MTTRDATPEPGASSARGRDDAAFEAWYAASRAGVHRALTLAAGDALLGEEVTAEAYARALLHWDRVSRMAAPEAWVYTVALHELRRGWRRAALERRATARHRAAHVPPPPDPDDDLWRAVTGLAPRQRTAIALRYVADLTEAEVAAAMNVSRGTVSATLVAARRHLARDLDPPPSGASTASAAPAERLSRPIGSSR